LTSDHFFISKTGLAGTRGLLSGSEHHHLSRVVRMRAGDEIRLFDEDGILYRARIERIGRDATALLLFDTAGPVSRRTRIVLGQSVLKAKAMDALIQKATELGIFAIVPLLSRRGIVRLEGESGGSRRERWQKIALSAAKQSHSGRVPRIRDPLRLDEFLGGEPGGLRLVLSERGGTLLRDLLLLPGETRPEEAVLIVGPEGGWDPAEEERILASGFQAVSLGKAILRAETAAVCAAAIVAHFWNA
jgi:16S rRNA (uracil1498-N3)-methyltransferase